MRIAVVIFMLSFTLPTWAGTLTDDFSDSNMDEWMKVVGNWSIDKGELVLGPGNTGLVIGEPTWKDYTVGVSAKIIEHQKVDNWTQGAFIKIRFTDFGAGYVFGIGTLGQSPKQALAYRDDGGFVARAESVPFEWELDTFYDLRFVVEGDVLKHYIDDELVVEYTDDTYPVGGIAITVGDNNNVATARFDDFYITGDDVPDVDLSDVPDVTTSITPGLKLTTTWGQLKK